MAIDADVETLSVGGDVVGPTSSANNRIAVFDGTTGKLLKDGGSTIADIVAGSGGLVTSVFGRSGAVVATTNDYTWAQIDKATSSLADIATRSAGDLSSGTLPDGRFPATLPAISGANLTNLNASNLASGTIPAGRMPALSGDVTSTVGSLATTIANNAVTLAKLADMATASFLGRNTAATGDPEVLSIATAKTMLSLASSNSGDVTLAGENYLSIAGQVVTANAVNLATSNVTGTLTVNKGGTGTATQFTAGSVVFAGASGVYTEDNTNLFWDNANHRLGVGTTSPATLAHLLKTQNSGTRVRIDNADGSGTTAFTALDFYEGATHRAQIAATNTAYNVIPAVGGGALIVWNILNAPLILGTNSTERLRIQGDGRIAVNTTSATAGYQLDVNGALRTSGDVLLAAATANLYMKDVSTGWQAASTTVLTPQANNVIRSTSYTSGLVGWNISALGNAEFNNVDVRGAIHASIFTYNAIAATAGTLGVFKSAAKLRTDVTIPSGPTYGTTTVNIDVVDPDGLAHAASQVFAVNDILRMKDGLVGDTWFEVTTASDQTTFWRYTARIWAGSANVTYRAGLGVADYGLSGQGFIIQTADQTNSPYMQMATHSHTFTSADAGGTLNVTPQLRIGNLNGSYGFAADSFGFGTGQYGAASKSWITVEQTNGIRIGNNTTILGQWDTAGTVNIGQVSSTIPRIVFDAANGIRIGTTLAVTGQWDISGNITVGEVAAGKSNVQITSGQLNLRNNTTTRIRLNTDGSGFLANSSISWDTGGNLTVAANATIAGWTINSDRLSSGTTYIAAGFDFPVGQVAWFGKGSTSAQGYMLRDAGGRFIDSFVGFGSIYPFMAVNDGTRFRVVLGGLNFAYGSDGSTDSMGMKVWDSAGNLIVHFSDVQNTISGWTIASTKISSTGIDILSGASAALAFGSTPPTSAAAGTGIWLDRTGLYGLASSVVQAKLDAATGAIVAGGGNVTLDVTGIKFIEGSGNSNSLWWRTAAAPTTVFASIFAARISSTTSVMNMGVTAPVADTTAITDTVISANNSNARDTSLYLRKYGTSHATKADFGYAMFNASNGVSIFRGPFPNAIVEPVASAALDVQSTTGAFIPPRMTTTEKNALTPTAGMVLWDTTLTKLQVYTGSAWVDLH